MLDSILHFFSPARIDLALDSGSARTRIARPGEGILLDEPSVLAVHRDNSQVFSGGCAVGDLALQLRGRTPDHIRVIAPIEGGAVVDYALCEAMFVFYFRKVRRHRFQMLSQVMAAVGASASPVQRRALVNCLQRAGARRVSLIPSAIAGAIGAGLPVAEPTANLICNIGAGGCEVAAISFGDSVVSATTDAGGDAMNLAILKYLQHHFNMREGIQKAEEIKIAIGSAWPMHEETQLEISGLDMVSGVPRKAIVTSEAVREALFEPLEELVDTIKSVIARLSPELANELIDNGLVLFGGGALLPGIDRYLSDRIGMPVRIADKPDRTVIQGTLRCLEKYERWKSVLMKVSE